MPLLRDTGPKGCPSFPRRWRKWRDSVLFAREFLALGPVTSIERAVLDGFGQVRHGQALGAFKVGDGAGNLEDAVVGARGESLLLHGALE